MIILPNELKNHIIFFLPPKDILTMRQVSSEWYAVATADMIWNRVIFRISDEHPKKRRRLISPCSSFRQFGHLKKNMKMEAFNFQDQHHSYLNSNKQYKLKTNYRQSRFVEGKSTYSMKNNVANRRHDVFGRRYHFLPKNTRWTQQRPCGQIMNRSMFNKNLVSFHEMGIRFQPQYNNNSNAFSKVQPFPTKKTLDATKASWYSKPQGLFKFRSKPRIF
eukprot:gb/GECH01013034.1/.p1 GENE.gb/GECH01013034.1/~~gb/GECH01013034.1/.p1  ORF type:complete len:219 (+),score=33.67 gb/GECH01013034.1/:1-657(+)